MSLYFGMTEGQTTIRLPDEGQTASPKYSEIDWNLQGPTIEDLLYARAKTCAHAFPCEPGYLGSQYDESYDNYIPPIPLPPRLPRTGT